MFQTVPRHLVAEGHQKTIRFIVAGSKKGSRFGYQLLVVSLYLGRNFQPGLALADQLEVVSRLTGRAKGNLALITTGLNRRIDERLQANPAESGLITILRFNGQRRGKRPTGRQLEACLEVDRLYGLSFGVKQNLVPADDSNIVGGGTEAASAGRKQIERDFKCAGSFRHGAMKCVHVNVVAFP